MNKNYGKMYNKPQEPVEEPEVEESVVETVAEPEVLNAVVANCDMLNVREEPTRDSASVAVINKGDAVLVDKHFNENGFCKVITESSIEGYCVRTYIAIEA